MGLFSGVKFAEQDSCFIKIPDGGAVKLVLLTESKVRKYEYDGKIIESNTMGVLNQETNEVQLFDLKKSVVKVLNDGEVDGLDFNKTLVKISRVGSTQKDTRYMTSTIPLKADVPNLELRRKEAQELLDSKCE